MATQADAALPPKRKRGQHGQSPLQSWHFKFASWLLHEPTTPTRALQAEVATRLANEKRTVGSAPVQINYAQLQRLKVRYDWREFYQRVEQGGIEAARAMFINDLPLYIELHKWAAERAKEKDDPRLMAALTTPAIDRVMPKREDPAKGAVSVTIHLTPERMAALEKPPIDVEVQELPIEGEAVDEPSESRVLSPPAPPPEVYRDVSRGLTLRGD